MDKSGALSSGETGVRLCLREGGVRFGVGWQGAGVNISGLFGSGGIGQCFCLNT